MCLLIKPLKFPGVKGKGVKNVLMYKIIKCIEKEGQV